MPKSEAPTGASFFCKKVKKERKEFTQAFLKELVKRID